MTEKTRSIGSTPPCAKASGSGPAGASPSQKSFTRALRDVLWLSSSSFLSRILNLARGVILARLLTPFDFGVYGLAGSIVGVKERIADIGAGNFLVYRPEEIEQHVETTFWVNLTLSSVLLSLLATAAPFLSRIYRQPLLTPVLVLLGLSAWARVNASIHESLLRTQARFRAMAIIENCSSVAWLAVAVGLAWKGFGLWALVLSALAANSIWAALQIATEGWKPRWHFSRNSLRLLGGFSFWYLGQGIAWYLVSNLDNLLVGRFLGMTLLGIYALAFNYALLPVTMIGNAMGSVAFAELPKLYGQPEAFWSSYLNFGRVTALLGCFAAFAAVVAAPDVFPLVFGHKWDASIFPFQILSVYAAVRCLWLDPFLASGNFRLSCLTGLVSLGVAVAGIGWGMRYGLAGVACAMLVVQLGIHAAGLLLVSHSWRRLGQAIRIAAPYFVLGLASSAFALGFRQLELARFDNRLAVAALVVVIFGGVYTLSFRTDLLLVIRQLTGKAESK